MSAVTPAALLPNPADPHAVAVTKLAIASLLGLGTLPAGSITPASIAKRAYEVDAPDETPRGVSTFTLRNNPACKALLEELRSHRQKPSKRRPRRVPPHIAALTKPDLLEALSRDRDTTLRLECAIDQLAVRLRHLGRQVPRASVADILKERERLSANKVPGHPPAACASRPGKDHARSVRLTKLALKGLKDDGETPTRAATLRRAKLVDREGRGLHDGIFQSNFECAELVRKAAGRPPRERDVGACDPALLRLDNYQLGLAVWAERRYARLLEPVLCKASDLVVDLDLPALLDDMRMEERRFRREELELARALIEE